MTNKNQFGKGLILGLSTVVAIGVLTYALTIPSNIENSVQTIKEIRITTDGTNSGDTIVHLNGGTSGSSSIEVIGTMKVGNVSNIIESSSEYSSIAGGYDNYISGSYSLVFGWANKINGLYSSIIGGRQNVLTGDYSTIVGGSQNRVQGDYSIAGGYNAQALHSGVFVWGDSCKLPDSCPGYYDGDDNYIPFQSVQPYTFLIRAKNGVGINTNNPGATLDVDGDVAVRGNLKFTDSALSGAYVLGTDSEGKIIPALANEVVELINTSIIPLSNNLVNTYWKESSFASGNIYYTGVVMFGSDFEVRYSADKLWLNTNIRFADPQSDGVERIISAGYTQFYQGADLKFVGGQAGGGGYVTNRGGHIILEAGKGSDWGDIDNPGPTGSGGNVVINGGAFGGDGIPLGLNGNILLANLRGNVGIGTSNPLNKLDVVGNVGIAGTVNIGNTVYFNNSTKRLGIGTSGPTQALDVSGNVKSSSGFCIGSNCITSWSEAGGYWYDLGDGIRYDDGNVVVGFGNLEVNGKISSNSTLEAKNILLDIHLSSQLGPCTGTRGASIGNYGEIKMISSGTALKLKICNYTDGYGYGRKDIKIE